MTEPAGARSSNDVAAPPSESIERLPGPDVVRALALIGVAVMNYHGYLLIRGGTRPDATVVDRFFDPFAGPLSTRFASTFVFTAGVGIVLLTRRVLADRDAGRPDAGPAIDEMRWRLVRRGVALYVLGQVLDVIWPGTIILYYGAMFVLAAAMFTLSSRWIVAVGLGASLAAWAVEAWKFGQVEDGESVDWLTQPAQDSIRRYVFDLVLNGTHPLLPWLAFLCAGIVVGRMMLQPTWRVWCGGVGGVLFLGAYVVSELASTPFQAVVLSLDPHDRGLIYVASALGSTLMAFAGISWVADRAMSAGGLGMRLVDPLRRAGQMTLTLYIAHILIFNLLVDWLDVIQPAGLGTALVFALLFWVVAIAAGTAWQRRIGRGPAERVYRAIGG